MFSTPVRAALAGHPLQRPKSTWSGSEERRRILARASLVVPSEIGMAGEMAGTDDVLDAHRGLVDRAAVRSR